MKWIIVSLPTFTFVKRVCGPISQRSPITVSPSSIVPGCKIVSAPTFTSGATYVLAGSIIVTPAVINSIFLRCFKIASASANCKREFTPRDSSKSLVIYALTLSPPFTRIPTTSVIYNSPCALSSDS